MREDAHKVQQEHADTISRLAASFHGDLIGAGHHAYDGARSLWKGVDRRPALIARCGDVADVQRTIEFAAVTGLPLGVMSTGHDIAGLVVPDDGVVLSASNFRSVTIDPRRRLARVGAGVRWGELVSAASAHGLATTGASVASVGVTGFSLHGGFGWLMRQYGTGCDNIAAVDLVTADGTVLSASDEQNPDVFWAMRGAGSNFGVVTALTLKLHTISRVFAGVRIYPAAQAHDVLAAYASITQTAPDNLVTHFYYMGNTDGSHTAGIGVCFSGEQSEFERALAPLSALGPPLANDVRERSTIELQAVHDESTPRGGQYETRAYLLSEISGEFPGELIEHCRLITAPYTKVFIEHLGGAIRRVPPDSTSFWGRSAEYSLLAVAGWTAPSNADEHRKWAVEFASRLRGFAMPGAYVNYLDDSEDNRVRSAYGPGYQRLAALKGQFDPANIFRSNRNIAPGALS